MAPRKKKSTASDASPMPEAPATDPSATAPEAAGQFSPEQPSAGRLSSDPRSQSGTDVPVEKTAKRSDGGRGKKKAKKSGRPSEAVYEKMVAAMLSAYVMDAIGHLSPGRRSLVELMSQEDPDWPFVIESAYGINRTLIRSIYALWTEHFSPAEAVLFVLRGLECPGGKDLEELVLEEFGP